jgi:hypothetical protein
MYLVTKHLARGIYTGLRLTKDLKANSIYKNTIISGTINSMLDLTNFVRRRAQIKNI